MYKRPILQMVLQKILEPQRHIQVLVGPRQVGKTTLALQLEEELAGKKTFMYASADDISGAAWINQQWEAASLKAKTMPVLLVLDEIQKIPQWSECVKKLWDQNILQKKPVQLVLLGSSALLMQKGLTESLAGRFETTPITHWSFSECRDAFGFTCDQYIYFGGYPGAAPLIHQEQRWSRYIVDALIETTVSKDILMMERINKPALLRRLFQLGCLYSGQILSYQKMMGQLQEAGNATTLDHYLALLSSAGLLTGLQKYAGETMRIKASSPKLNVLNTALMTAQADFSFKKTRENPALWGRLVECAVGAHLINGLKGTSANVLYWRDGNYEVDFVLNKAGIVLPIEVKSTLKKTTVPGIDVFLKKHKKTRALLVGAQGISVEDFLCTDPSDLF